MTTLNSYQIRDQLHQAERAEAERQRRETEHRDNIDRLQQQLIEAERVEAAGYLQVAAQKAAQIAVQNGVNVFELNRTLDDAADLLTGILDGAFKQVNQSFEAYVKEGKQAAGVYNATYTGAIAADDLSGGYNQALQANASVLPYFTADPAVTAAQAAIEWINRAPDAQQTRIRKAVVYALTGELVNPAEHYSAKQQASDTVRRALKPHR